MSLQCAVSALNKVGFDFQPYKGDIESGCDDAVAEYRDNFYPALENYLECQKFSSDQIDCAMDEFEADNLDVYVILIQLALDLDTQGELDPDWADSFKELAVQLETIGDKVKMDCDVPTIGRGNI